MVAALVAVEDAAEPPAVAWVEVRCRNPRCRALLFRWRALPGVDPAGRPLVAIEWVCPDRRCRRCQTVALPAPLP